MIVVKYIFTYFLLIIGILTFSLSFSMILNLYCFKFLRKKIKWLYYYFCNILSFSISIITVVLLWKFTNDKILTIVLEFLLLVGVTIGTNDQLLKKFNAENLEYDNDKTISKLIKNNADSCYLRNIIVWFFYVVAVVINSLLKLKIISIEDSELVFMFESAECSVIILLAIITLIDNIKKKKKIKKSLVSETINKEKDDNRQL